jgi:haloacetate dehalogenase
MEAMSLLHHEFEGQEIATADGRVFLRRRGRGPAVLLLHGFPETHVAWHRVAPRLAEHFTVFVADLPGYGDSLSRVTGSHPERYSKRAMAATLVEVMTQLDVSTFAVVGHDRGARVAYRMALDHPSRISHLAVLDVVSVLDVANRLTYRAARQMTNWFWLASPSPIPEQLISADPELYLDHIIESWGGAGVIAPEARAEYVRCFRNPAVIAAICDEYRAGDTIDIDNDRADRAHGRRIVAPMLVLWSRNGLVGEFGDPIAIWRQWADHVSGGAMTGGHFMMEESPEAIVTRLEEFLQPTESFR